MNGNLFCVILYFHVVALLLIAFLSFINLIFVANESLEMQEIVVPTDSNYLRRKVTFKKDYFKPGMSYVCVVR
jgi:hypothetical protein